MIDQIKIHPDEPSVYDLTDLGIEGQLIISSGLAELWTETEQWTIGNLDEEERELMLYSLDPPESKRIKLNDDAFYALNQIIGKLPIPDKTNIVSGNDWSEAEGILATYEI